MMTTLIATPTTIATLTATMTSTMTAATVAMLTTAATMTKRYYECCRYESLAMTNSGCYCPFRDHLVPPLLPLQLYC